MLDGARSCAVCLEEILPSGEAFLTTVCKHHFHFRCIRPWVGRGPCPSCRCADWLGEPPPGGDVPLLAPDAVRHASDVEPDVAFVPAVERFHVDGRLAGPNILNQVFPAPRYNAEVPLRQAPSRGATRGRGSHFHSLWHPDDAGWGMTSDIPEREPRWYSGDGGAAGPLEGRPSASWTQADRAPFLDPRLPPDPRVEPWISAHSGFPSQWVTDPTSSATYVPRVPRAHREALGHS
uniref:RING-type domain-containing protein n=1 Tax=Noctiluca scintillans TaxID=2966 RepID=A0A7S1F3C5_NOCSC